MLIKQLLFLYDVNEERQGGHYFLVNKKSQAVDGGWFKNIKGISYLSWIEELNCDPFDLLIILCIYCYHFLFIYLTLFFFK